MIRAAMEGVVCPSLITKVAVESGVSMDDLDLRAMGGIANSEFWVQILPIRSVRRSLYPHRIRQRRWELRFSQAWGQALR